MRYFLIVLLSIFSFSNAYAENDDEIVDVMQTLEAVNKRIVNINTDELNKILDTDPSVVLIDVRSPFELKHTGTIARGQNVNIVRGWLEFQIGDHAKSKDTPIIVYCGRNLRSPLAAKTLENMGYTNVKNYADGFFVWKEEMNPVKVSDYEPDSILYRLPEEIAPGVYSAIGATQPYTYENSNHNNNLSFIVTTDGVLVFNAGGSYLVAKAMHEEIKKVTDQKVKYVVLENSQGHAILGSNYWKEQGAIIIAHVEADKEIRHRGEDIYARTLRVQKEKIIGTKVVFPDLTFKEKMPISMGNTQIELMHIGASHSPDDIQLWLPQQKILISGDTAFNERMLPIFSHTNAAAWIETWDKIEALEPALIIPGHGEPTDLATITKFTKDYLVYMRTEVEKVIDDDGGLYEAYSIDQSMFRNRGTFRELHKQNAERIFKQMEFE
ncbi:MAG TPA: sulfurtransferase [Gammaproteobacteria bacterium]|jgi:glyoxylase-like metal-dependent hydrolase (beta-lactamase superfamily II)/rhodanese-related sulfurtransferase|nr:sulfurtransferase [Gammaproteobacteria bacterium]HAO38391.1 sulfurtransferase [Gammaproteobacteria bacterium]HAP45535.1 sulfurtransferase [Gammaproteobacteria bacterium]HCW71621.1 sulfurtransferase [Gammaproteobacteria bacterium]